MAFVFKKQNIYWKLIEFYHIIDFKTIYYKEKEDGP